VKDCFLASDSALLVDLCKVSALSDFHNKRY